MKDNDAQSSADEIVAIGESLVVAGAVDPIPGQAVHAEPKEGGSYIRCPETGDLKRVEGPGLDTQPEQEQ